MHAKEALFSVGQVVRHRLFHYRGVIVDVDPEFQGTEDWYDKMARTRPPKAAPWYHVLVHREGYETYVAEQNLEVDTSNEPIEHPQLEQFFRDFRDGMYQRQRSIN